MLKSKLLKAMMISAMLLSATCLSTFPSMAATVNTPTASQSVTFGTGTINVDASNTADGYVMVKYTGSAPRVKVRIKNATEYTYDLNTSGQYETFPLTEGSGTYTILVFENLGGNRYSTALSKNITVTLSDANRPFLFPNQFCNYNSETQAIKTGDTLVAGKSTTLSKVEAIYKYAVDNISYDYQKAQTVQSGYLPNIDDTLNTKKGICFDYAALMTAMLRTQDIPTKLVIGYAGSVYHAWISVYTVEQGWIDNVIQFDGTGWKFMDPTFASSGKGNASISAYINDPANYAARFSY